MAMVVKNNMSAVRTLNTLNQNSSALQKSLAKVSSGMKINSAQDDASGYAISERMRVQIRSLDQANQNTQNASSLMKTAEGAVSSTVEILKSLKEKAINAATDTNTDSDRATIQKELDQFIDQIDDNALTTFNGKYLVDGSKSHQGQATHTAMTNQSLATDTTGTTALVDLKNRNNESLEIKDTDYVTASFVHNGKTYTTKFSVESATLDQVFQNMNAEYMAQTGSDTGVFAGGVGAAKQTEDVTNPPDDTAVNDAVAALTAKIADEINTQGTVTADAKDLADAWTAGGLVKDNADGTKTVVDPKTDIDTDGDGTPDYDGLPTTGSPSSKRQSAFDDLMTNVDTEYQALKTAVDNYNAALGGGTSSAPAVKAADGTEITADNASTYKMSEDDLKTMATSYGLGDDASAEDILKKAVEAMNGTISTAGGSTTFADDGSDLEAKKAEWIADTTNNPASDDSAIAADYANAEKVYNHIQASSIDTEKEEGSIVNSVTVKNTKNSEDAAFTIEATTEKGLVGVNSAGDKVFTGDGTEGLTVTARESGVKGQISGVTISITDSEGNVKKSANAALDAFKTTIYAKNKSDANELSFQVGANANQSIAVGLDDMRSEALGLKGSDGSKVSVATQDKANAAVAVFDNAIQKVLDQQATIGAIESRLEYTSQNLTTSSENVQAAESTIRDADMAKEMTNYTKNNVLLQAAQSMLAQANQNSSAVLSLLQ